MQNTQQLFEDISKMASGAFSAAQGMGQELHSGLKAQFEHFAREAGLVTRAEWMGLQAMLEQARLEQDRLAARVEVLERAAEGK